MTGDGASAPSSHELVVVPGHAVYLGGSGDPVADDSWSLLPFQAGEPVQYEAHVAIGVATASETRGSLVFSGGVTRADAAPRSEAAGYRDLAARQRWFGDDHSEGHCLLEEYARDSFENLLFSLCCFRAARGAYPGRVTVVGWMFKRERFDLHRQAIAWPADAYRYIGRGDPVDLAAARAGEARAVAAFREDPYGGHGELASKRRARDPLGRGHPYAQRCPELADLLGHRGPELYDGALPWR